MDGQNMNNNLYNNDNNQNADATPVITPMPENGSVYSSYNYQGDFNSGSSNYQDNTAQTYTASVYDNGSANQNGESTPGLAIISLVLGIISILCCCCWGGGIVLSIPGIITGIYANKKNKTGVGTAGIICSIVGTVLNVLMLFYFIFMVAVGVMADM